MKRLLLISTIVIGLCATIFFVNHTNLQAFGNHWGWGSGRGLEGSTWSFVTNWAMEWPAVPEGVVDHCEAYGSLELASNNVIVYDAKIRCGSFEYYNQDPQDPPPMVWWETDTDEVAMGYIVDQPLILCKLLHRGNICLCHWTGDNTPNEPGNQIWHSYINIGVREHRHQIHFPDYGESE